MDSGSITALAAEALPYLNTFTVGFDMTSRIGMEVGADERVKAEAMSYQFRTEHYEVVLKSGDMERCLPALVWHLEDPRVGQSYPNFYGARLAGKFVKVVLSGSGGDELFAGYPWRYYRAVVNDDFDDYIEKYYGFWHRLVPNTVLHRLFAPDVWNEVSRPADDRHLPRPVPRHGRARRAPRTTSTTRSTSRRRRSCPGSSSSRTSSAWPTASRAACRSSTTTSWTSPSACRCASSCATSSTSSSWTRTSPARRTSATSSARATASCCCGA